MINVDNSDGLTIISDFNMQVEENACNAQIFKASLVMHYIQ